MNEFHRMDSERKITCRLSGLLIVVLWLLPKLAAPCCAEPTFVLGPAADAGDAWMPVIDLAQRRGANAFKETNRQFKERDYETIIKQARLTLQSEPDSGLAYEVLGSALFLMGSDEEAIVALEKAASVEPQQSGPYCKLGIIYMKAGQIDQAQTLLQRALTSNGNDRIAHQWLGLIFEYKGDDTGAIEHFRKGLEDVSPSYLGVSVNLGRLLNKNNRYHETIAVLGQRLPFTSTVQEAHMILGTAYYQTGQYTMAQTRFERALELKPESLEAGLGIAMSLRKSGNALAALMRIEKTLNEKPDWLPAIMEYGETLLVLARLEEAEKVFAKGVALGSNLVAVQKRIAGYHRNRKEFDEAEKIYRNLIDAGNADIEVYVQLSELLQAKGKHDQGLATLKQALRQYPGEGYLHFRIGAYLAALGRYQEAIPELNLAVKGVPNDLTVLKTLCFAQAKAGDNEGALSSARKLHALSPDKSDAAILHATRLQAIGYNNEAESIYRRALATDAGNVIILNNLAALLADKGDLQEAERLARQLTNRPEGKSGIFLDTLGWILYRQNRYTEAIEVLGAATKSAPNVAVIHFHLGMTLAASGDHTAARKSLNQAISMDKDADWVAEARTKLGN